MSSQHFVFFRVMGLYAAICVEEERAVKFSLVNKRERQSRF